MRLVAQATSVLEIPNSDGPWTTERWRAIIAVLL
jgi:hypothetical protein